MTNLKLAIRLGWGTLRSRPTLTLLAVGLLALGTAAAGALFGTVFLLRSLQSQFLTALTLELELAQDNAEARIAVVSRVEAWPNVEHVHYLSADEVMREIERETGEDLGRLFGTNPFPSVVQVRFGQMSLAALDRVSREAAEWSEVSNVVYPRTLWSDLQRLATRVQERFGWASLGFVLAVLVLVGLCLRAQVRNLRRTWEFLTLLGMSRHTYRMSLLFQEIVVGMLGGLLASVILVALAAGYSILLLRDVEFPMWFHLSVWLTALLMAVISGVMSPRRIL